jgi:tRNA nucleotidyltransferase/poly(A) polymerase
MEKVYTQDDIKKLFPNASFDWIKVIEPVLQYIPGEWRFVGGCVRDSLLGIQTYDIDISTLCKPNIIEDALKGKFTLNVIGQKFGTIGVYYKGWTIEITTTRKDIENFGRYATVEFNNISFYEDSARRDFTINALMMNRNMEIYDYHDGIDDLLQKVVKFVGNSDDRIQEDYLRVMRYIRFFIRFSDGEYDKNIIKKHVQNMLHLSRERIIKEIESMCKNKYAYRGFDIMNETGISNLFFHGLLRTDIDDSLTLGRKLAYALYDIDIEKWPINRDIKRIHSIRIPANLTHEEYLAYIWNKYKDVHILNEFNHLLIYLKHKSIDFDINVDLSLSENFEGKQRGISELFIRYMHIMKKPLNLSIIIDNMNEFYCKIKKNIA